LPDIAGDGAHLEASGHVIALAQQKNELFGRLDGLAFAVNLELRLLLRAHHGFAENQGSHGRHFHDGTQFIAWHEEFEGFPLTHQKLHPQGFHGHGEGHELHLDSRLLGVGGRGG
jgi:hypothetical protein